MDKLHTKFSALNVDFDGPSIDFLGSRIPAHEGIKERYPRKSHDETAGGKLIVCEQEMLYAFACLVSISSNFLFPINIYWKELKFIFHLVVQTVHIYTA